MINAVLSPGPKKFLSTTTTFHLTRTKFLPTTKLSPDPNKISPDHNSPKKILSTTTTFHLTQRKFLSTTKLLPDPNKISPDHKTFHLT